MSISLGINAHYAVMHIAVKISECSGSVVECLTRDPGTAGSSLTGITAMWSLNKVSKGAKIRNRYN